jgi:hypothetical protein
MIQKFKQQRFLKYLWLLHTPKKWIFGRVIYLGQYPDPNKKVWIRPDPDSQHCFTGALFVNNLYGKKTIFAANGRRECCAAFTGRVRTTPLSKGGKSGVSIYMISMEKDYFCRKWKERMLRGIHRKSAHLSLIERGEIRMLCGIHRKSAHLTLIERGEIWCVNYF